MVIMNGDRMSRAPVLPEDLYFVPFRSSLCLYSGGVDCLLGWPAGTTRWEAYLGFAGISDVGRSARVTALPTPWSSAGSHLEISYLLACGHCDACRKE